MPLLEYLVTRPFTIRHFTSVMMILGVIWATFITVISIADAGYNTVSVTSTVFNSSQTLWYERFPPMAVWLPKSWACSSSLITPGQG
jgi:hypothetical protein